MSLLFLEDLYFGTFKGYSGRLFAVGSIEYSSSASYHPGRSDFGECSSPSKHNAPTNRETQKRLPNAIEHLSVYTNTSTETDTKIREIHRDAPLIINRYYYCRFTNNNT